MKARMPFLFQERDFPAFFGEKRRDGGTCGSATNDQHITIRAASGARYLLLRHSKSPLKPDYFAIQMRMVTFGPCIPANSGGQGRQPCGDVPCVGVDLYSVRRLHAGVKAGRNRNFIR